ncbi:MAG: NADH-quinone oxidoreductase subunit NuoG [bacterium]
MPQIVIDGRSIEVASGTKVIEAAQQLGIYIPRLCYHPALGSAGACRLCAVSFLEGPVRGLLMSCMVEAKEGMVVSTQHPDALQFRKQIMEWLMMNHPHDCPVCDEGGHCVLQEMTVAGGHSMRRFPGSKRTYEDQDLGPFVQHEMNRCIHCWRCRRFYQEYSGYKDMGVMGLASRTYFGRAVPGPLESPFAGNLIDICPTGVFTDKPSRFKARRWECQRAPSLCIHCCLGCSIVVNSRYREVLRIEAGHNPEVNGHFICDRGRYGFDYVNHPSRPRWPLVEGRACSWQEALAYAGGRLREIIEKHGPSSAAVVGSSRASLESLGALRLFCEKHAVSGPFLWMETQELKCVRRLLQGQELFVSMKQVEEADTILVVGLDPVQEAPMLALALRQAWRKGGWVGVVDPRGVELPFCFSHWVVHPREMGMALEYLAGKPKSPYEGFDDQGFLKAWRQALARGKRPVMACGTLLAKADFMGACLELAHFLRKEKGCGGLFPVLRGANSLGAVAVSGSEASGLEELLEAIERGELKALVLVETDPLFSFWGKARLKEGFKGLELILVMDYLPSGVSKQASVVMPCKSLFESSCLFVNNEGRLQEATAVHHGGIPISQMLEEANPPRTFGTEIPGGGTCAGWEALAKLSEAMGESLGFSDLPGLRNVLRQRFGWLREVRPGQRILALEPEGGKRWEEIFHSQKEEGQGALSLLLVQATFGTEELSSYSRHSCKMEAGPMGFLHPETAACLGLKQGDLVRLGWEQGELEFLLETKENMHKELLVVQAHRLLDWDKAGRPPEVVNSGQLEKII